jgi:hypothetical protein
MVHGLLWSLLLPVSSTKSISTRSSTLPVTMHDSSTDSKRGKRRRTVSIAAPPPPSSSSSSSRDGTRRGEESKGNDGQQAAVGENEPSMGTLASCWWWCERSVGSVVLSDLNRDHTFIVDIWSRPYYHASWGGPHTAQSLLPSSSTLSSSMEVPLSVRSVAQLCTIVNADVERAAWLTLTNAVQGYQPSNHIKHQQSIDESLQMATGAHEHGRLCSLYLYRSSHTRVQCVLTSIMTPSLS